MPSVSTAKLTSSVPASDRHNVALEEISVWHIYLRVDRRLQALLVIYEQWLGRSKNPEGI